MEIVINTTTSLSVGDNKRSANVDGELQLNSCDPTIYVNT